MIPLRFRNIVVAAVCSFCLFCFAHTSEASSKKQKIALSFVKACVGAKYPAAVKLLSPKMKAVFGDKRLSMTMLSLELQLGKFKSLGKVKAVPYQIYLIVMIEANHVRGSLIWRVVVDNKGKVAGLQFLPTKKKPKTKAPVRVPPYAKQNTYVEKSVVVGSKWKLKGTLSLPKGKATRPAVILVHGSGPHDQDETIGPNKIFRDVAWGLASQGVVVLRYTKRTRAYGKKSKKDKKIRQALTTVEGEVIEDVGEAVALLQKTPGVDPKRIYVLGHSLGGMLAPAIAVKYPKVAGIILMAGAIQPLELLVLNQYIHVFSSDGKITKGEKKILFELMKMIITLRAGITKKTSAKKLPLHIPAVYWMSLKRNDPAKLVKKVKQPILVLQGKRDYQVTVDDYILWKKALKGRKDAKFILYPTLNHLFLAGKGPSLPKEYTKPGFVHEQMIKDVAVWVKSLQKKTTKPASKPAKRK